VPEDISLIGFDDNFHARHLTPALTTVRQPVDAVGRMAAEMLSRMIEGDAAVARELTVPTELIVRQSLGPVAAPKPKQKETAELRR
jgi:LacI family transcriptional regulator